MLQRRSLSAVVVLLVTTVPAVLGGWVFMLLLLVVGLAGLRELSRAFTCVGWPVPFRLAAVLLTVVLLGGTRDVPGTVILLVSVAVAVPLASAMTRPPQPETIAGTAATSFAVLYLAAPLAAAWLLRGLQGQVERHWLQSLADAVGSASTALGLAWLAWCLSVTWLTDTSAYLVGSRLGRVRLAPRLSPGKTREGAAAGLVTGTAIGLLAALLFGLPLSPLLALGAGLVVSLVAQAGDLAESLIKRSVGVKDMGQILPGHGGIVDRIDALLFTLPLTLATATLVAEGRLP